MDSTTRLGPYPTRPSEQLVREILDWIKETGEPHRSPHHSHTRPPRGATVVYLAEFDLPATHRMPERWAPCPICRPNMPWYFRGGMVAWFPDEGFIRMIGPDCYKTLVGAEQHQSAMEQFRREKQEKADAAFVATRVPILQAHLPEAERAAAYCVAIDTYRGRLIPRMGTIHGRLWSHVRASGDLRTVVEVVEIVMRSGQPVEERRPREQRYGQLAGHRMLHPFHDSSLGGLQPLGPRAEQSLEGLKPLLRARIMDLPADERPRVIRRITKLWSGFVEVVEEARGLGAFLDLTNVRTLRSWATHEDAPLRAYFDLVRGEFLVGPSKDECTAVRIPEELRTTPPELPRLS